MRHGSEWNAVADSTYFCGLDLGTAADHSALVIAERRGIDRTTCDLSVGGIRRYELGLNYQDIINDVARRLDGAPKGTRLMVDSTGVGRPVFDLLKRHPLLRKISMHGIIITGGDSESHADGNILRVPKRDLIGALQTMLGAGRLKLAAGLPETQLLLTEMRNFKMKISISGHDTYEAWRENIHDDLVLSVAMACWSAIHPRFQPWRVSLHPRLMGSA